MALPTPASTTTVVVTGASSGIGAELARELARRGYGLTLVARRADRLKALADEIGAARGVTVAVEPADLSDRQDRERLLAALATRTVVGLCNNAGYGNSGRFQEADLDKEQAMVELNCAAPHHLMRALLPGFVAAGAGAVLNVASLAGVQPMPFMASYAATKAFVLSLSEGVHAELAGTGVSVTALLPGPVHTEFEDRAGVDGGLAPELAYLEAPVVARQAVDGMASGRRTVVPSLKWKTAGLAGRFVPRTVYLPLAKRFF
ncbi:MAG: SDR family NAD(P)-dependent oxidoreductase [Solirubrobacteraceae bacterium]